MIATVHLRLLSLSVWQLKSRVVYLHRTVSKAHNTSTKMSIRCDIFRRWQYVFPFFACHFELSLWAIENDMLERFNERHNMRDSYDFNSRIQNFCKTVTNQPTTKNLSRMYKFINWMNEGFVILIRLVVILCEES